MRVINICKMGLQKKEEQSFVLDAAQAERSKAGFQEIHPSTESSGKALQAKEKKICALGTFNPEKSGKYINEESTNLDSRVGCFQFSCFVSVIHPKEQNEHPTCCKEGGIRHNF